MQFRSVRPGSLSYINQDRLFIGWDVLGRREMVTLCQGFNRGDDGTLTDRAAEYDRAGAPSHRDGLCFGPSGRGSSSFKRFP